MVDAFPMYRIHGRIEKFLSTEQFLGSQSVYNYLSYWLSLRQKKWARRNKHAPFLIQMPAYINYCNSNSIVLQLSSIPTIASNTGTLLSVIYGLWVRDLYKLTVKRLWFTSFASSIIWTAPTSLFQHASILDGRADRFASDLLNPV